METAGLKISGTGIVFNGPEPGDIVLVDNRDGNILSKLIRFVTGRPWSHTAVGSLPLANNSTPYATVFEANQLCMLTPWYLLSRNRALALRVYRLKNMNTSWLRQVALTQIQYHNGESYGYLQLLWFVWRRMVELLHLPSRWAVHNFFPRGEICTEIVWEHLRAMMLGMPFSGPEIIFMRQALNLRDQEGVTPGDVEDLMQVCVRLGYAEVVFDRVAR